MIKVIKEPKNPKYSFCVPISREWNMEEIIKEIEGFVFPNRSLTEILVYFDGKAEHYEHFILERLKALKNLQEFNGLKVFCSGTEPFSDEVLIGRRQRVIEIWETFKLMMSESSEITFGLEDDIQAPANAFLTLNRHLSLDPNIGYATGAAVGRWEKPILGVWHIVYNEAGEEIEVYSLKLGKGLEYIEGAGLYCFAVRSELIRKHTFADVAPCLSVDVNFVASVGKSGYKSIVDWSVLCNHVLGNGRILKPNNKKVVQTKWIKKNNEWEEHDWS